MVVYFLIAQVLFINDIIICISSFKNYLFTVPLKALVQMVCRASFAAVISTTSLQHTRQQNIYVRNQTFWKQIITFCKFSHFVEQFSLGMLTLQHEVVLLYVIFYRLLEKGVLLGYRRLITECLQNANKCYLILWAFI